MNASTNWEGPRDARYHQHTAYRIVRRVSTAARRRVHALFLQSMQPKPGDRLLDVGVSDDIGADSNMLEQLYPWRENLTCASLSDGQAILSAYPGVRHVRIIAGEPLPFAKNQFDIVYSNAVIEHAGARSAQGRLIQDMCRVAPRRFLVVPNRAFPIEHHTCLPLLHYLPQPWFRWLLRGTRYDYWSREVNLNYVSIRDFQTLWPAGTHPTVAYAGLGFGPWKSNLVAYQT